MPTGDFHFFLGCLGQRYTDDDMLFSQANISQTRNFLYQCQLAETCDDMRLR